LLANQLPEHRAEDQHRVTWDALGSREIADRVIRAKQMRVAVDDEESFHCSDVLEAGLDRGGPETGACRLRGCVFIALRTPGPAGRSRAPWWTGSPHSARTRLGRRSRSRGTHRGTSGATRSPGRRRRARAWARPARACPRAARREG